MLSGYVHLRTGWGQGAEVKWPQGTFSLFIEPTMHAQCDECSHRSGL